MLFPNPKIRIMHKSQFVALLTLASVELAGCLPQAQDEKPARVLQAMPEVEVFRKRIARAVLSTNQPGKRPISPGRMLEIALAHEHYANEGGSLPPCEAGWRPGEHQHHYRYSRGRDGYLCTHRQ